MSTPASRMVPVTLRTRSGPMDLAGEATACPHLVITPTVSEGCYAGEFTLTHLPSGYVVAPGLHELISDLPGLRALAGRLAGLDWSSPDPALYAVGTPHHRMLSTALRQALGISEPETWGKPECTCWADATADGQTDGESTCECEYPQARPHAEVVGNGG